MTDGGRDMASATTLQRTEHLYDTSNRISSQSWQLGDRVYTESYTYDADNGTLTYVDGNLYDDYAYTYDGLHRVNTKYCWRYTQTYSYRGFTDSAGTARTTTQVSRIDYSAGSGGQAFSNFSLAYEYDNLGNIKKVTGTNITGHDAQYTYDIQGQLTSETVNDVTYNYAYDTYGNIRGVSGGESHTYTYGNDQWRDLLIAYDSKQIAYEGQTYNASTNTVSGTPTSGNPISYYNGTRWNFTWEKGRQMVKANGESPNDGREYWIDYEYDVNGIRTSKYVYDLDAFRGTTYNYLTQNGKVVRQTWGSNTMDFIYDNAGRPYAMVYNGSTYYYILNQQGDVIRIVDDLGGTQASYIYNAWGKLMDCSGWLATTNPIRYRGYYYDNETGFYYLQSRYYDPSIGRFINADGFVSTGQSFIGFNMFAYCGNNPVNYMDELGASKSSIKVPDTKLKKTGATATKNQSSKFYGTVTIGISLCLQVGYWAYSFQAGLTSNVYGETAIQLSAAGGTTTTVSFKPSLNPYVTLTNAPSYKNLEGPSTQVGGSVPGGMTLEYNLLQDADDPTKVLYQGITIAPCGSGDVHVMWGSTFLSIPVDFNMLKYFDDVQKQRMMLGELP